MDTRERAVSEIYVDDKQAAAAINGLMQKADELKKKMFDAMKMGDVDGYKKHQAELTKTEKEAQKLKKSYASVDQVLKNIKSAPLADLQNAAKKLQKEMQYLNRDSQEYINKLGKLQAIQKEISLTKMNGPKESLFGSVLSANLATEAIRHTTSAITDFATASWDAALNAQKNQRMLEQALDGNTEKVDRYLEKADEWSMAFAVDDDVIIQQQTYLAQLGRSEKQINQIIPAAQALSTVTGKDLAESVKVLNGTMEGKLGRDLPKLNSEFANLTESQLINGDAITLVSKKYGEFADDYASTVDGELTNLETTFENLQESIGGAVTSILEASGALDFLNDNVANINETLTDDKLSGFGKVMKNVQDQVESLLGVDMDAEIKKLMDLAESGTEAEKSAAKVKLEYIKLIDISGKYQQTINAENQRVFNEELEKSWKLAEQNGKSFSEWSAKARQLADNYGGFSLNMLAEGFANLKTKFDIEIEDAKAKKKVQDELDKEKNEERKKKAEEYRKQVERDEESLYRKIKGWQAELTKDKLDKIRLEYNEELAAIEKLKVSAKQKEEAKAVLGQVYKDKYNAEVGDMKKMDPRTSQQMMNDQLNAIDNERLQQVIDLHQAELNSQILKNEQAVADEQAAADKKKAIYETLFNGLNEGIQLAGQFYEQQKQKELKAAGDNEARKAQIEKKYFERQKKLNIAEVLMKGATEVAMINANPMVTADLSQTWRILLTGMAVARTAANVALIAGQQFAAGRYPVSAPDGNTYNASVSGVKTGYYSTPTLGLFAEKAPEIVVDGATTRSLMMRKPWVVDAIYKEAGLRQYAAGNYPDANVSSSYNTTPALDMSTTNALLEQLIVLYASPKKNFISYNELAEAEATYLKITGIATK